MDIISYGIEVQESGDRYISLAEEVMKGSSEAVVPSPGLGVLWVDLFSTLAYVVTSWFLQVSESYTLEKTLVEKPFSYVQEHWQLVGEPILNLFIW